MNFAQSSEKIKEVAKAFDDALEEKNYKLIKSYFEENCEIELLGVKLKGHDGVEKWLDYIFSYVESFSLQPLIIIVENNVFFEEFLVKAILPDKSEINSKWAEVLIYENYKILSLRLYFDRLEFAKSAVSNFFARKVIKYIERKTLEGLI